MRVRLSMRGTAGGPAEWFADPLALRDSIPGVLRAEGWTLLSYSYNHHTPSRWSSAFEWTATVSLDTLSDSADRVRNRAIEVVSRMTGKPVIATVLGNEPAQPDVPRTSPGGPSLGLGLGMAVIGLVAVAVILVRVKP